MAISRFQNMQDFMPDMYRVGTNKFITAIIKAWCNSDEEVAMNIQQTKNQLFVRLASAQYLNYLGSNVGVPRPTLVPVTDDQYRQYIIAAGYKPKTTRKLIYEILDIFFGESKSRSNVESTAYETFNFSTAPLYLDIITDNNPVQQVKFVSTDFVSLGAATAQEVCNKINYSMGDKLVAETFVSQPSDSTFIRIYTGTPGLGGSIQIVPHTDPVTGLPVPSQDANIILGFPGTKQQTQEVTVVELYPNHIILKIPADIQIGSSLKSSTYLHPDATIIDPRPNPITSSAPFWPGNFLYDYDNIDATYSHTVGYNPTNVRCLTTSDISISDVINQLGVDDDTQFPSVGGYIMFGYGSSVMEKVKYTGRASTGAPGILGIDPTHIFQNNWPAGTEITLLEYPETDPRSDGSDYAIYFVDTGVSQELVEELVDLIKAAGVILEFDVKETEYMYGGGDFSWSPSGGGGNTAVEAWFQPPKMLDADEATMISTWGVSDKGKIWYNETRDQLKGWNGSSIVILG